MQPRSRSFAVLSLTMFLAVSAGCSKDGKSPTAPVGDTTAPMVSSTNPQNGATGVAFITATFNEPMTASTLSNVSFYVTGPGAATVPGAVSYNASSNTVSFTPLSGLVAATSYTATITAGAKDASGNAMTSAKVWSFTTNAASGSPTAMDPPLPGRM